MTPPKPVDLEALSIRILMLPMEIIIREMGVISIITEIATEIKHLRTRVMELEKKWKKQKPGKIGCGSIR